MKKIYLVIPLTILIITVIALILSRRVYQSENIFQVRSIDTTKYSRDLAGQMLGNPSFDQVINQQVSAIAQTGANYVAIDSPYDDQYLPFLRRWITSARNNNLHVWFRGNFSGWEGWFGYQKIDRTAHLKLMDQFILKNPDLFEDGDIFTACPECENGGPGDPRQTGDVAGFRSFMISEYYKAEEDFGNMGKKVTANYDSMNYDVAKVVMDKQTTEQMGGVVTIDHYVKDPSQLTQNIDELANSSGGQIVLGEFGAPIPDINGAMSDDQQAEWINQAMEGLSKDSNVAGLNYWTGFGGSTAIWDDSGSPKAAVSILQKFFNFQKKIVTTF